MREFSGNSRRSRRWRRARPDRGDGGHGCGLGDHVRAGARDACRGNRMRIAPTTIVEPAEEGDEHAPVRGPDVMGEHDREAGRPAGSCRTMKISGAARQELLAHRRKPSRSLRNSATAMASITGPISLARKMEVCMSCPFAGMTRIRFKGCPHDASAISAGSSRLPSESAFNVGRAGGVNAPASGPGAVWHAPDDFANQSAVAHFCGLLRGSGTFRLPASAMR